MMEGLFHSCFLLISNKHYCNLYLYKQIIERHWKQHIRASRLLRAQLSIIYLDFFPSSAGGLI